VRRIRQRRRWIGDVIWFLVFLVLAQVGLVILLDWRLPQLHDLEYGARLGLLRKRIAEAPDRPLCLVVGSSRITMGFVPEILPPLRSASGEAVLPFNFGHLGGGPLVNLMSLNRLIREGIHPRWVVLEVMPTLMEDQSPWMTARVSLAGDLPLLDRYLDPWTVWGVYLRTRLNPWYSKRLGLLRRYASCLAVEAVDVGKAEKIRLKPLGGDDGWIVFPEANAAQKREHTDSIRATYYDSLQHFRIDPQPDRAMRECLQLCRQQGIECALLITPESDEYRSWYGAGAEECFARYVDGLQREFSVQVIDASRWVADEHFLDATHLMRPGAAVFTERLGREMLEPLVAGRLQTESSERSARR
jgi:hypothetical protein